MLKNTFLHMPGVGVITERRLWESGILSWNEYVRNNNRKALETLLAYNIQDTITLERLMVIAYNLNLKDKPFYQTHQLELPDYPEIPFKADRETVDRIKGGMYGGSYY